MGTKTSCSKPKAIRGVKARRIETTAVDGQSTPPPQVDCNVNYNYTNTNSTDNTTTNIMASNNNYTHSTVIIALNAPPLLTVRLVLIINFYAQGLKNVKIYFFEKDIRQPGKILS
jgi:hypothetical protein